MVSWLKRRGGKTGDWGLLLLFAGLVAFIAWALYIFTHPRTSLRQTSVSPADEQRVVALITQAAPALRTDPKLRAESLGAMRVLPAEARTRGIIRCLKAEGASTAELRNAAAYFAAAFVSEDKALVRALIAALARGDTPFAAYGLAKSAERQAFTALAQQVTASNPATSEFAIWALAQRSEPEATDVLLETLATGGGAPEAVVKAIGYRRDSKAYRPLVNLLKAIHPTEKRCWAGERAAVALGYLGQRAAIRHLREAAHRVGDWATPERLAIAFALCRLRSGDEYNFWLLSQAVKNDLPPAPYRRGQSEGCETAIALLVQLNDQRVRPALVAATQNCSPRQAECLLAAFRKLGLAPVWDAERRAYVLGDLPPEEAPDHPPWEIVPPWPFSEKQPS